MIRYVFIFILFIHGIIHMMGFAKAFGGGMVSPLIKEISKPVGVIWFFAGLLFVISTGQFFMKKDSWWILSSLAIIISQMLILSNWQDSKYGTIANVIILVVTIIGIGTWNFRTHYENEVKNYLKQTPLPGAFLTEADIRDLPMPVKKYLYYTGSVGKPKIKNFKIVFNGQIRKNKESAWMPFTSEQYNFMDQSVRLFLMNATMLHMPVAGYHCFLNGNASMDIRLFSLFKVQHQTGDEMNISETVTFFNDMCCMAPATLIDKRINWLETDSDKVKASFTNNGITISAWLYFNEKGELINFISDDRYAADGNNAMRKLPWSTPMKDYKEINGNNIAGYADAIYRYPEGDLYYGNFQLVSVQYNCKEFK